MRLYTEAKRLLADEFDYGCRHRAKPVNEEAEGFRMSTASMFHTF
ncbi:MAG: hypothetical protein ACI4SZ_09465 [Lachnospiraceae bacterium]